MPDITFVTRTLVIDATGNVGQQVASQLSAQQSPVRAFTRNPGGAHLPPEVDVAVGDVNQPETPKTILKKGVVR